MSPADKTYTVGLAAQAAAYRRHAAGMAGAGDGRDCVSVLQDGMVRSAMRWSIQMHAHQALGDLTVSPADKTYTVGLAAQAAAYRRHAAGMAGAGDGRDCVSVLQDGMVRGAMQ